MALQTARGGCDARALVVLQVVTHLRSTGRTSTIGLWGRSMGAATALMHSHRDPSIAGIVLDSPFADLRQLANVGGNVFAPADLGVWWCC